MKMIKIYVLTIAMLLTLNSFSQTQTFQAIKLHVEHPSYQEGVHDSHIIQWNRLSLALKTEGNSFSIEDWRSVGSGIKTLMHVDINGKVGIGTTTPDARLAVNGNIHAKEVKVDLNGWSDFVFNDNYKLKDLEEVDSFIQENKHLPDIPSEKEVKEKGINLGDMDAKLLQKIEELTLYMIDQNKKTNKLIEEVQGLKVENKTLKGKINILESI